MTMEGANRTLILPPGWIEINSQFLMEKRGMPLTPQEAIRYFDGVFPTWKEALSPDIPHRLIVQDLITMLNRARQLNENQVIVLLGAGGEGKSTVLRQTACILGDDGRDWRIIWRN